MKNRAWWFLLPALAVMSLSAFIPLMTVINYAQYSVFPGSAPQFIGMENFADVLGDGVFLDSLRRQVLFSIEILLIEIPLGLGLALALPKKGKWVGWSLVLLGIPLLIPWNVVGIIWRVFTRSDLGAVPAIFNWIGYGAYNASLNSGDAWWTVVAMDVWHWTPLVILLCYAGLQAIPEEFYRAAKIDGASAWSTFRYVTLPKLRHSLILAVLLRFMDSFKIYAEPFQLTGGGPGNSTTLLSIYTSRKAIGGFNMGFGAAVSIIYFFLVILISWLLYTIMMNVGGGSSK
ncbi:sugar ABC transporter permease [Candidatus Bipolaricaulota bacterium]|nr:sugar ABC transporter permease [Candidatus Bipolaricaulota bacterium]